MTALLPAGETLDVPERVIVSPASGVFSPADPGVVTAEGELVLEGQAVGTVRSPGSSLPVTSPFTGFLMGMLAAPGERLRTGQPVAWLRRT